VRIVLVGFGNVGRTLAAILADPSPYAGLKGLDVSVVAITTGSHGTLANPAGIALGPALASFERAGGFTPADPDHSGLATLEVLTRLDYDAVVEMSPLDVVRRGEPAISHVRAALERGRHVVAANKGPVAWSYRSLVELAARTGARFLHEATVMDGVPVFNLARHGLRGATVLSLEGILNSTTNWVLGAVEQGRGVEEAVAEARRAGVAEADPSLDLDGWDAAVKLAALANAVMGGELLPEDVERRTLASLDLDRVRGCPARGRRLKMVAAARRDGGRILGRVEAREIPLDHPFALVEGTSSILRITTDLAGSISVVEEAPDLRTTAYGVLSDLMSLAD
jgi:homoserine dehydrogenase